MTILRRVLFGKLNQRLFQSLESATAFCKLRGNPYVEVVHWLHQLLNQSDGDLQRILRHAGADPEVIDLHVREALASLPGGAGSVSDFSYQVEIAVERAWISATLQFNDSRIRGGWLIHALATDPELRRVLLGISPEFRKVPMDDLAAPLRGWIDGSPEAAGPETGQTAGQRPDGAAQDGAPGQDDLLAKFCTDLTARARDGGLDPVLSREIEIRAMVDVLMRRRQNNPLLTGEAGVGKTAVVEGLAIAIAQGVVPPMLAGARVLNVDIGAMLAGASVKGEFESRLKGLLDAAKRSAAMTILFIDEMHTLIGAGGQAGTGDAANLLKPMLARGDLRVIGATTWAEYKRYIEKDPALTRRFHMLQVAEPQIEQAVAMVRGLVPSFARHHGVLVRDDAVRAAVTLSQRYLPTRQLPDKAISLLDTACARVALSQHAPPKVLEHVQQRMLACESERALLDAEATVGLRDAAELAEIDARMAALRDEKAAIEHDWREQRAQVQALLARRAAALEGRPDGADPESASALAQAAQALRAQQGETPLVHPEVGDSAVAEIVADWTGIPVGRMLTDEITAVRNLQGALRARVIGQEQPIERIVQRVRTARAGLSDPQKPQGVFLLAGPSGVGKTETALALAEALYGGEQNLISINLSEYQEAHTVSGLRGAPPGYVGYGEGGVLTEAVRRRPYSVILLDEVEKAHSDVHELFFQVFDKGYMEDGDGRYIDFRNTVILLTTNVASELISTLCADEDAPPAFDGLRQAIEPDLLARFPAALLGRLTVIPYAPLRSDALASIVRLHLDRVVRRMSETLKSRLSYEQDVVDYVVAACRVDQTGARALIGHLEQHILPRLASLWMDAMADRKTLARVDILVQDKDAAPEAAFSFQPHLVDAN
ncbi:type VI secretion system ATPase TssH [Achromobacter sp. MFA1 R4]|uniref:type VI secretion system ATPase TssH n=1 Tax=Achromobacter sp. MFA1 R4 TaxID=1881016 RepID=UPI000953741B|nr:type VI secretion system ATPase TssH [Achromobacter sp. MFA1 R4]SIT13714.1 type VI secretion system protein VasG [Achromobacter sp. MFA1 R4]